MSIVHRSPATTATFCTRLSRRCFALTLFATLVAATTLARAQWVAVNLHPPGAQSSQLYGGRDGIQVGKASVQMGEFLREVPAMWRGTAGSFVNLLPANAFGGEARGVFGSRIVGSTARTVVMGGGCVWDVSSPQIVETSFGSQFPSVTGVYGDRVVGQNMNRASLWSGSSLVFTDLTPPHASSGFVSAACEAFEVGSVTINQVSRAAMWSGTAESWVDLHPDGSPFSGLYGCYEDTQVGTFVSPASNHAVAAIWTGSRDSVVNLDPPGSLGSAASGVWGDVQVGYVTYSSGNPTPLTYAALWRGSSESYLNLHNFLPPEYTDSVASAVYEDPEAGIRVICGTAWTNRAAGVSHAFVWTQPLGETCVFLQQPQSTQLVVGATASFTATFARSDHAVRWRRNGVLLSNSARISGAESTTLSIQSIGAGDQAQYELVATGICGTMISHSADLSCKPIILDQPTGRIVLQSPLQLRLTVPQGVSYTYRWRQNGQNLFNFPGFISGATTPTLNLLVEDESLLGTFDCVLTNVCGTTITVPFRVVSICDYDYNQDENVDLTDAQLMAQVAAGVILADPSWLSGDLNQDENADLTDAQQLANYVALGVCGV